MTASRRDFLSQVGQGMLLASVGSLAFDLGLTGALAGESDKDALSLTFGKLEPLVRLMQETPPDKLLPKVVSMLESGTSLKDCVAAAALANARAFGGEDYVGFHTLMALSPSYAMAGQLPSDRRALPVLKVIYRNAKQLHHKGGDRIDAMEAVAPDAPAGSGAQDLRALVHKRDRGAAERTLATIAARSADEAFNDLMITVEEAPEVHRVVLAHRAWDMLQLVGKEHAVTMLRQSLRYCVRNQEWASKHYNESRELLPKLLDQYKLLAMKPGDRKADDAWIDRMSQMIFSSSPAQAADAVAGALAEGFSQASIGEAISLAANQLVLRDVGRVKGQTSDNKPVGSVHGDSIGVHACDSAHAWRHIAAAANPRNACAALILAGYQVAHDRISRGGKFLEWQPQPDSENLEKIAAKDAPGLLRELDGAIRENNQAQACAAAHRYGEQGFESRAILDVLLKYATSEDGALHAEKYYRTTTDEFAATRRAFRWRQIVALARVTASEYGTKAPGYEDACKLLKVKA
ncbi:MAG: hypothetical protein WD768_21225 [Phycisphaeraceae bacterium]